MYANNLRTSGTVWPSPTVLDLRFRVVHPAFAAVTTRLDNRICRTTLATRPCAARRSAVKLMMRTMTPLGDWLVSDALPTLWSAQQKLRVDTAGVQAIAARWGVSASELHATVAPAGLGLSCQVSAAAVNAAHADVVAFTAGLALRVGERATGVTQADTSYLAQEAASAVALEAVAPSLMSL